MQMNRRGLLNGLALGLLAGLVPGFSPSLAAALTDSEASAHVQSTIDEVVALVNAPGGGAEKAPRLRDIMERRAAMPEIARFAAGVAWRSMSGEQQTRYVSAFSKFVSAIYAARFQEYSGTASGAELYQIGRVVDAGKKGMLVKSTIARQGEAPVAVDWLVTDSPGRVVIADIVIEGVSMLVTQREEIGGMLESRGGDVERLITDLSA